MKGDDDLAAIVRAFDFQLVSNITGHIIAKLGYDLGSLAWQLSLNHNHAGTADSALRWSSDLGGGSDYVAIVGPADATATDPANVEVSNDNINNINTALLWSGAYLSRYAQITAKSGRVGEATAVLLAADPLNGDTATVTSSTVTPSVVISATKTVGAISATITANGSSGAIDLSPSVGVTIGNRVTGYLVNQVSNTIGTVDTTAAVAVTAITGVTKTLNLVAGDIVDVGGVFDMDVTVIGAGNTGIGTLYINGAQWGQNALMTLNIVQRITVATQWVYPVPATAAYTFTLRIQKVLATGTLIIRAAHTSQLLRVYSTK